MTGKREQQLKALFQQEQPISPSARRGLDRSYEQIRRQCREQEGSVKKRGKRPLRLLMLAAVLAAMMLGAGAIALHTGFFHSAFGTGVSDTRTVTEKAEDGIHDVVYPVSERVEVDEEAAQAAVGEYVAQGEPETTVSLFGYTAVIQSWLVDENGIGVLTYTLENPDGLHDVEEYMGGGAVSFNRDDTRPGSGIVEPRVWINGTHSDSYTYIDRDQSTDTKATLVIYFTPFEKQEQIDYLEVRFTGYQIDDDLDITFYDDQEVLTLPVTERVPVQRYWDEDTGFTVSLSQLGMMLEGGDLISSLDLPNDGIAIRLMPTDDGGTEEVEIPPDWCTGQMELLYVGGDSYLIEGDGIANYTVASETNDGTRNWMAFNRLVTEEVSSVELDVTVRYGYNDELDTHLSLTPAD